MVEANQLRCVTRCTSGVAGAIDCHQGQCLWVWGPRCEATVHWRALVGGLAGAAALLVLLLLALGFLVVRSRPRGGSRLDR